MKLSTFMVVMVIMMLTASCAYVQSGYGSSSNIIQAEYIGDGEMDEIRFQELRERMIRDELPIEEFSKLDRETANRLIDSMPPPQRSEEEAEAARRAWEADMLRMEERMRNNFEFLIRGDFIPVDGDVDLQTIQKFAFYNIVDAGVGYTFVMDMINERVYYDPDFADLWDVRSLKFSSDLVEGDLDRLIQSIKESGMLNWEIRYESGPLPEGVFEEGETPQWIIGILFDDGTIMRRSGSGRDNLRFPPDGQFDILSDFIQTLGAEIAERHEAEVESAESKATESDDEE